MFDFDFSQIPDDPARIHDAGGRPSPGKGMAVIRAWEEYGGANGKAHKLSMEIVAWSTPADVGKSHEHLIFYQDTTGKGFPMRQMACLSMAAGLFTAADVRRWKAEGERPQIDMSKLVGRPIMIELIEEPDQKDPAKKYIRIGNIGLGFWHCTDSKTKDWPKDIRTLNAAAALIGQWDAPANAKPAAKPAPAPVAKPAGADPFSGF